MASPFFLPAYPVKTLASREGRDLGGFSLFFSFVSAEETGLSLFLEWFHFRRRDAGSFFFAGLHASRGAALIFCPRTEASFSTVLSRRGLGIILFFFSSPLTDDDTVALLLSIIRLRCRSAAPLFFLKSCPVSSQRSGEF